MMHLVLLLVGLMLSIPSPARSGAYFEDGYLGLTQQELRAKLGEPHAVRDRKAALRVFNYYSLSDWDNYFKKLVSPQNGEDVYNFKRGGYDVRYSFGYLPDPDDVTSDFPTLYVRLVDVEFTPAISLEKVESIVPEFKPPTSPSSPAFRSNLWLLIFSGAPSEAARTIIREQRKDAFDWTLAYQLFALQGLPEYLTLQAPVDRLEISAQSAEMVKRRQRLTHEPILNPFSKEYAERQPPPPPAAKKVPVPKYAD
ncbi:MAG TPA: hypothetical protein VFA38_05225 [Nitrospirales bacterium]|nr:hypothetical protein [Nitrospirales bacterium]